MVEKIEQLKMLIEAHKNIEMKNGLSESGKNYLAGLERAYRLLTGRES